MAIGTPTLLGQNGNWSTSPLNIVTATLPADELILVAVSSLDAVEPSTDNSDDVNVVTVSGDITFDRVGVYKGASRERVELYAARGNGTSQTVRVTWTSNGIVCAHVVSVPGARVRNVGGQAAGIPDIDITLPAFASGDSAGMFFPSVWYDSNPTIGATAPSGLTQLGSGVEYVYLEQRAYYKLATTDNRYQATYTGGMWSMHGLAVELEPDIPPPELVTLTPADNATEVSVSTDLTLEFNEDVSVGTGDVRVYELIAPSGAPTVEQRATDTTGTGDTTSFSVDWTIPGGSYQEGDIIFVALSKDDDDAFTSFPPANWASAYNANSGTATRCAGIWRRFATGNTTNSVSVTGDSESYAARIWLVRGAHRTTAPFAPTPATGTSASANPPLATFPWGTEPTLCLAIAGGDGNGSASAYPSGSSNTGTHHSGHSTTGSRSWLAYCEFASVTAGSLDPSAYTNTNEQWIATTVAFRPHDPTTLVETIDITDSGQVTFADDTVTIELSGGTLEPEKSYAVQVDAGAILSDATDAPWPGISGWNFSTAEGEEAEEITGTGASSAAAQVASGAGSTPHAGAGAAAAAAQITAGTGAVQVVGAGESIAAPQALAAQAQSIASGSAATLAPAQELSASGVTPHTGTGETLAPAQTTSATGLTPHEGTGETAAPTQQLDAQGDVLVAGQGQTETAPQSLAATGATIASGAATSAAAAQLTDGSGVTPHSGVGASSSPAQEAAGSGVVPLEGTASSAAPAQVLTGEGEATVLGAGSTESPPQHLDALGSALAERVGTATTVSPAEITEGVGAVIVGAVGTTEAPAQELAAVGITPHTGAAASQSPAQAASAAGVVVVEGDAATQAAAQQSAGSAQQQSAGVGASVAPPQELAGSAVVIVSGAGASQQAPHVIAAAGGVLVEGAGASQAAPQILSGHAAGEKIGVGATESPAQVTQADARALVAGDASTSGAATTTVASGVAVVSGTGASASPTQQCSASATVATQGHAACVAAPQVATGTGFLHRIGTATTFAAAQELAATGAVIVLGECATHAAPQQCSGAGTGDQFIGMLVRADGDSLELTHMAASTLELTHTAEGVLEVS